jgi:hypothetical protein
LQGREIVLPAGETVSDVGRMAVDIGEMTTPGGEIVLSAGRTVSHCGEVSGAVREIAWADRVSAGRIREIASPGCEQPFSAGEKAADHDPAAIAIGG